MEEKKLSQIKFSSFLKLNASIFFSLGMIMGLVFFIVSLFGGEVTASLGAIRLQGIAAGVASLLMAPFFFSLVGLIFGLISFLPYKLFLKIIKGIKIEARFE